MIYSNGYILAKLADAGGLDADGYPIDTAEVWSEPIKCIYQSLNLSLNAISQGEKFTNQRFRVLIDLQPFESGEISIHTLNGDNIGCFEVDSIIPLTLVGRVEILTK